MAGEPDLARRSDLDTALAEADAAMYEAKRAGGMQYAVALRAQLAEAA
jgi:GGDEF domain-containing protein